MTTKYRERATHPYPAFGFSSVSEKAADERIAAERLQPKVIAVPKLRTYEELLAQIDELLAENAALKSAAANVAPNAKPRKMSSGGKSRGRRTAESVVMRNRITYYSMAHVAKLTGLHQSNVSRQIARQGIKLEFFGSSSYIPASQVSNIKRRKR